MGVYVSVLHIYVSVLSYIHTKIGGFVAVICVRCVRILLLRDLAVLHINYRLQRLYWLGDFLVIGILFAGRYFGSQVFMMCEIRREITIRV